MNEDLYLYSPENVLTQIENSTLELGYHRLEFYVDELGFLSKIKTNKINNFLLSPAGGTLLDMSMNIVVYSAKYDKYKGYGKS